MFKFSIEAASANEALAFMAGLGALRGSTSGHRPPEAPQARAGRGEGRKKMRLGRRERSQAKAGAVGTNSTEAPMPKSPAANAAGAVSKRQATVSESPAPKRPAEKRKGGNKRLTSKTTPKQTPGAKGPRKPEKVTGHPTSKGKGPKKPIVPAGAMDGQSGEKSPPKGSENSSRMDVTPAEAGSGGESGQNLLAGDASRASRTWPSEVPEGRRVKKPRYSAEFPPLPRTEEIRPGGKAGVKK